MREPARISPTAHYTGHVWVRNGLSNPELATREGRVFFDVLSPAMLASRVLGGPTLEAGLLARHRLIDHLLAEAVDEGRVGQVVEVACGMSPRGWRFAQRYGEALTYVEADLPEMAKAKREALERIGSLSDRHRVVELDALRDDGPGSLAELVAGLDPGAGLAIVTEGLLTYFDDADVQGMWRRFAAALSGFPSGLYVADLRLTGQNRGPAERVFFGMLLPAFVRGQVHTHFEDEAQAAAALREAGFAQARLHRGDEHPAAGAAPGDVSAARVNVIEATA